jgi:hypothetical protein
VLIRIPKKTIVNFENCLYDAFGELSLKEY